MIADNESSAAFIRNMLELADSPAAAPLVQIAPPGSTLDKLFASGFAAVIAIAPASKIMKDKSYEQVAKRGGFTLNAIEAAKALTRKYPGIIGGDASTAGTLSSSPAIPEDDVDTVGLQWLLVTQSRMSTTTTAGELARLDLREQVGAWAGKRLRLAGSNRPRPTRMPTSSPIRARPNTSTTTPSRSSSATAT